MRTKYKGGGKTKLLEESRPKTRVIKSTGPDSILMPGQSMIDENNLGNIDALFKALKPAEIVAQNPVYEVEIRQLIVASDNVTFNRILRWMLTNVGHSKKEEYNQSSQTISDPKYPDFYIEAIYRDNNQPYLKVKVRNRPIVSLNSAQHITPAIGISIEFPDYSPPAQETKSVSTQLPKKRTRWIFPVKLDETEATVDLTSDNMDGVYSYSIEIELNSKQLKKNSLGHTYLDPMQIKLLDKWIKILIRVVKRTGTFLTTPELQSISSRFMTAMETKTGTGYIPSDILNKPKDLQRNDLSWLSPEQSELFMLMGDRDLSAQDNLAKLKDHKVYKPLFSIPGGYSVSLKADGTRYFLYFDRDGLYLVAPESRVLTKISGQDTQHPGLKGDDLTGTILDCEVIGEISEDGTMDYYEILAFDLLAKSNQDMRNLGYVERQKSLKLIVESFGKKDSFKKLIQLELKPVYRLPHYDNTMSVAEGLEASKQLFEILTVLVNASYSDQSTNGINWSTDGLIFTPSERPYLEYEDVFGQIPDSRDKDRVEKHNYSLIRKWKPELTIDFLVSKLESGQVTLFSHNSKTGDKIEFKGDYNIPWNGSVELTPDMIGKIIEFKWTYSDKFLDNAFVLYKERVDRSTPNSEKVAMDVWRLIHDPVTSEHLRGTTLNFMRRYHNKVKRFLLSELSSKIKDAKDRPVLLDIGSGRGGDIFKWNVFSEVYAVEPDVENMREFLGRLNSKPDVDYTKLTSEHNYAIRKQIHSRSRVGPNKQDKIKPLNIKGEESYDLLRKIKPRSVNCVTMFNALTFFYQDQAKLKAVINSIRSVLIEGGYFYAIAFDGELLLNSMRKENSQDSDETYGTMKSRNITISKSPDATCRKIWIKIEDSIVRGQYEYLISCGEFSELMDSNGFKLVDERYLNEELLLSREEYWFSSMFKVMKFKFFSNPNKKDLSTFLKPVIENMEKQFVISPLEPTDEPQLIKSTQFNAKGITGVVRYGVVQNDSALIHAALTAISSEYRNMAISERHGTMIQIRQEMANAYTLEIHNSVAGGFFASSGVPAHQYVNMRASLARSTHWIHPALLEHISNQLGVNIHILRGIDPELMKSQYGNSHIKPGRKHIILYWLNDNHYETIGVIESRTAIRTVFDDSFINRVLV